LPWRSARRFHGALDGSIDLKSAWPGEFEQLNDAELERAIHEGLGKG
jgi:hypothetical protein